MGGGEEALYSGGDGGKVIRCIGGDVGGVAIDVSGVSGGEGGVDALTSSGGVERGETGWVLDVEIERVEEGAVELFVLGETSRMEIGRRCATEGLDGW